MRARPASSSEPTAYAARSSRLCSSATIRSHVVLRARERTQELAQALDRVARPALDRPERLTELGRDLDLREAAVVRELDRAPLRGRQRRERVGDRATRANRLRHITGRRAQVHAQWLTLTEPPLMKTAAQHVHRAIARNSHQPPRDPAPRGVVRLAPVPRAQQRVLQDLA